MRLPEDRLGLTPVEELFRYDIFGLPPRLEQWQRDPASYELTLGGRVTTEKTYTLEALRGRFTALEREAILQCMTNVHWGRVLLKGPRLADVLADARPGADALKLALRGAEEYTTDLIVAEVLERPEDFLLVYEMNGAALAPEHGFPLRLAATGKYAYKWCKWLTRIEVLNHDFKGHYEGKRGWSDAAVRGRPVC